MNRGHTGSVIGRSPFSTVLTQLHAGLAAGQSPVALHAAHGSAVAAAVWGMSGGVYAPALDVVRPWTRGVAVDAARFAASVEMLLAGGANPAALAAPAVFPGPRSRYYVAPQVRSGPARFDDAGFAVFATPVGERRVDPLLDHPAVWRSFSRLETIVARGPTLDVPALGVRAYAPPGTRLATLTDLYAHLADGAHQLWLIERVLYVVPHAACDTALCANLAIATDLGVMTCITALTVDDAATASPSTPLPFLVPAIARTGDGPGDPAQLLAAVRTYWLTPPATRAPLDLRGLGPLPTLVVWLQAHADLLHPTDVRRLEQVHRAVGQAAGQIRIGQVTAAVDHVVGICAEIALRPAVVDAFTAIASQDPNVGLWVEGELATPDGKRISDALLMQLDRKHRSARVHTAWELAAGSHGTASAEMQHTRTLQERLPAQGVILEHGPTAWARVAADTTTTQRITQSLDPAAARDLRRMAEQAIAESLAYQAFHTAVLGTIPAEERRRYRGVRGRSAAGLLWASIVEGLWATGLAQPGPFDLAGLVAHIESRLRHFPLAGRPLIAAELACLHNLAVPLHPIGPRQSPTALATATGVSYITIARIQARLTTALAAAQIPVHDNPNAAWGIAIRAGVSAHARVDMVFTTWQALPPTERTAEALVTALDTARTATDDAAVATFFSACNAALHNLAVSLNPDGPRQSAQALGTATGVGRQNFLNIQIRLTAELTAAQIPVHDDPGAALWAARRAHARVERVLTAWQALPPAARTAAALATALATARTATDDASVATLFSTCNAALHNLAVPLAPHGPRQSIMALARTTRVGRGTIQTLQARLTAVLTVAQIPVHADPMSARVTATRAGKTAHGRIDAILAAWQALAPPDRTAQALATAFATAQTTTDDADCVTFLAAWHTALHNLAAPLSLQAPRKSRAALAHTTGVSCPTIQKIQARLTAALVAAHIPIHADPEAAHGIAIRAGKKAARARRTAAPE